MAMGLLEYAAELEKSTADDDEFSRRLLEQNAEWEKGLLEFYKESRLSEREAAAAHMDAVLSAVNKNTDAITKVAGEIADLRKAILHIAEVKNWRDFLN